MDLVNVPVGAESKVKVFVAGGKLGLSAVMDTKGVDASVSLSADAEYFIDELAKLIPGVIDDAVLAIVKQALKQL